MDETIERALAALERVRDTLDTIRTGEIDDRADADGVIEECETTLEQAAENLERLTKHAIDTPIGVHEVSDAELEAASPEYARIMRERRGDIANYLRSQADDDEKYSNGENAAELRTWANSIDPPSTELES